MLQRKDLISVLMPVYNVEKFVEEAVESILNQSYRNIELIIIDDCSTDDTYRILQGLSARDSRIKLYRNAENQKICRTLNKALRYASGAYIARMDGDDICDVRRLEILKKYLDRHNKCVLVGSQVMSAREDGGKVSEKKLPRTWGYIKKNLPVMCCILHIWLARREIYDVLGGYREIPFAEDYDFLLRGMRYGFHYANVPYILYTVRTRSGNTQSSNGIYQAKARYFVKKLYKKECAAGKDLYRVQDYEKATASCEMEKKRFYKAYQYMEKALNSRENKVKLLENTLMATICSKYYMCHIIETFIIRIEVKREEKWLKKIRERKSMQL